jgi:serine/threonine protein kinase
MSPEQALGRTLDARSDLYTVGVVLFELFTGQRPFAGTEAAEVMQKHVSAEPPRLSVLRADVPEYLERIVLACLSKRADRRPASAADLYNALTRVAL